MQAYRWTMTWQKRLSKKSSEALPKASDHQRTYPLRYQQGVPRTEYEQECFLL